MKNVNEETYQIQGSGDFLHFNDDMEDILDMDTRWTCYRRPAQVQQDACLASK